jgi:acyl-CoA dehydrogenase
VAGAEPYEDLRRGVREVCARFPDGYWRELDAKREYPGEFVGAMTEAGYLGALIPRSTVVWAWAWWRLRSSSKR